MTPALVAYLLVGEALASPKFIKVGALSSTNMFFGVFPVFFCTGPRRVIALDLAPTNLQYGNGTLRLTTRQAYQLHGVLKHDLKSVFSSVIKNMGSTLAACGDVNRNVMAANPPYKNKPEYKYCTEVANDIADLLAPQSGAYYDVWLDGEKFMSMEMEVGAVEDESWAKQPSGSQLRHIE